MITRDMIIGEIIRQHPSTVKVFERHGLECTECQIADLETIEHGAGFHKIDIDSLIEELNLACNATL